MVLGGMGQSPAKLAMPMNLPKPITRSVLSQAAWRQP